MIERVEPIAIKFRVATSWGWYICFDVQTAASHPQQNAGERKRRIAINQAQTREFCCIACGLRLCKQREWNAAPVWLRGRRLCVGSCLPQCCRWTTVRCWQPQNLGSQNWVATQQPPGPQKKMMRDRQQKSPESNGISVVR